MIAQCLVYLPKSKVLLILAENSWETAFAVVLYFTSELELVSNILRVIVAEEIIPRRSHHNVNFHQQKS